MPDGWDGSDGDHWGLSHQGARIHLGANFDQLKVLHASCPESCHDVACGTLPSPNECMLKTYYVMSCSDLDPVECLQAHELIFDEVYRCTHEVVIDTNWNQQLRCKRESRPTCIDECTNHQDIDSVLHIDENIIIRVTDSNMMYSHSAEKVDIYNMNDELIGTEEPLRRIVPNRKMLEMAKKDGNATLLTPVITSTWNRVSVVGQLKGDDYGCMRTETPIYIQIESNHSTICRASCHDHGPKAANVYICNCDIHIENIQDSSEADVFLCDSDQDKIFVEKIAIIPEKRDRFHGIVSHRTADLFNISFFEASLFRSNNIVNLSLKVPPHITVYDFKSVCEDENVKQKKTDLVTFMLKKDDTTTGNGHDTTYLYSLQHHKNLQGKNCFNITKQTSSHSSQSNSLVLPPVLTVVNNIESQSLCSTICDMVNDCQDAELDTTRISHAEYFDYESSTITTTTKKCTLKRGRGNIRATLDFDGVQQEWTMHISPPPPPPKCNSHIQRDHACGRISVAAELKLENGYTFDDCCNKCMDIKCTRIFHMQEAGECWFYKTASYFDDCPGYTRLNEKSNQNVYFVNPFEEIRDELFAVGFAYDTSCTKPYDFRRVVESSYISGNLQRTYSAIKYKYYDTFTATSVMPLTACRDEHNDLPVSNGVCMDATTPVTLTYMHVQNRQNPYFRLPSDQIRLHSIRRRQNICRRN